jgi:hypothetical protein
VADAAGAFDLTFVSSAAGRPDGFGLAAGRFAVARDLECGVLAAFLTGAAAGFFVFLEEDIT